MNTETEQWSTITEAPEYEVSTKGRVRNKKTGIIIAGSYDKDGYTRVTLSTKGPNGDYSKSKIITRFRHRLVAQAFIPNPNNYPIVNHKDENKANSNVENLEWCTIKYNINYGEGAKIRAEKLRELQKENALNNAKKVFVYDKNTHQLLGEYRSISSAAKELHCDYRTIYKIAHGIVGRSCKGMLFSFEPLQFD